MYLGPSLPSRAPISGSPSKPSPWMLVQKHLTTMLGGRASAVKKCPFSCQNCQKRVRNQLKTGDFEIGFVLKSTKCDRFLTKKCQNRHFLDGSGGTARGFGPRMSEKSENGRKTAIFDISDIPRRHSSRIWTRNVKKHKKGVKNVSD